MKQANSGKGWSGIEVWGTSAQGWHLEARTGWSHRGSFGRLEEGPGGPAPGSSLILKVQKRMRKKEQKRLRKWPGGICKLFSSWNTWNVTRMFWICLNIQDALNQVGCFQVKPLFSSSISLIISSFLMPPFFSLLSLFETLSWLTMFLNLFLGDFSSGLWQCWAILLHFFQQSHF